MLKCLCSCLCSGPAVWVMQRVSAVLMLLYFAPILGYWLLCPNLGYMWWSAFLSSNIMLGLLLLNLVMFLLHAMIGFWTVFTDYISNKVLRNVLLLGVFGYLALIIGLAVVTIII